MNWLDWLIVVIITLSAFQGLRRGLLASLAGLAGIMVGLFVAHTYYLPLAQYLVINYNVEEKIKPLVMQLFKIWAPSQSIQSVSQPGNLISAGAVAGGTAPNIGDYLANSFTSMVLESFCFLALLMATTWGINLVGFVLTKAAQFSLLGTPNRLGGLLFGAVRGLAVVVIILALLTPFQSAASLPNSQPGTPGAAQRRSSAFEGSELLPYFEPLFEAIGRPLPITSTVLIMNPGGAGQLKYSSLYMGTIEEQRHERL